MGNAYIDLDQGAQTAGSLWLRPIEPSQEPPSMECISRSSFLRGKLRAGSSPIRPPWAQPEAGFQDSCDACGRCIKSCPESILVRGSGGLPHVDFSNGECTFCERCVSACPTGALARAEQAAPWTLKAVIAPNCLALNQVVCRLCEEHCAGAAIRFRLNVGGGAFPAIDSARCNGCGACVSVCPVDAVTVRAKDRNRRKGIAHKLPAGAFDADEQITQSNTPE